MVFYFEKVAWRRYSDDNLLMVQKFLALFMRFRWLLRLSHVVIRMTRAIKLYMYFLSSRVQSENTNPHYYSKIVFGTSDNCQTLTWRNRHMADFCPIGPRNSYNAVKNLEPSISRLVFNKILELPTVTCLLGRTTLRVELASGETAGTVLLHFDSQVKKLAMECGFTVGIFCSSARRHFSCQHSVYFPLPWRFPLHHLPL